MLLKGLQGCVGPVGCGAGGWDSYGGQLQRVVGIRCFMKVGKIVHLGNYAISEWISCDGV